MADSKLADLTAITTPADDDLLYVVHDPAGTPVDRKVTVADLRGASAALPLLHVRDEKAQNTSGGSFTSGAWQTRTLNTVKTNEITGASLASNKITLPSGTYEIDAAVPGSSVDRHQARLYNVTDSAVVIVGKSSMATNAQGMTTDSLVRGRFTLAGTKDLRIEHYCQTTYGAGFGLACNFTTEVYAEVLIRKVA